MSEQALLTEAALTAMGVGVLASSCDVRDRDAVERFVAETQQRLGGVHFLINNAGIASDGALWRLSEEAWSEVLDTNVTGAFNCIRAVAPIFRGPALRQDRERQRAPGRAARVRRRQLRREQGRPARPHPRRRRGARARPTST